MKRLLIPIFLILTLIAEGQSDLKFQARQFNWGIQRASFVGDSLDVQGGTTITDTILNGLGFTPSLQVKGGGQLGFNLSLSVLKGVGSKDSVLFGVTPYGIGLGATPPDAVEPAPSYWISDGNVTGLYYMGRSIPLAFSAPHPEIYPYGVYWSLPDTFGTAYSLTNYGSQQTDAFNERNASGTKIYGQTITDRSNYHIRRFEHTHGGSSTFSYLKYTDSTSEIRFIDTSTVNIGGTNYGTKRYAQHNISTEESGYSNTFVSGDLMDSDSRTLIYSGGVFAVIQSNIYGRSQETVTEGIITSGEFNSFWQSNDSLNDYLIGLKGTATNDSSGYVRRAWGVESNINNAAGYLKNALLWDGGVVNGIGTIENVWGTTLSIQNNLGGTIGFVSGLSIVSPINDPVDSLWFNYIPDNFMNGVPFQERYGVMIDEDSMHNRMNMLHLTEHRADETNMQYRFDIVADDPTNPYLGKAMQVDGYTIIEGQPDSTHQGKLRVDSVVTINEVVKITDDSTVFSQPIKYATGAGAGKVLMSDADGLASWSSDTSFWGIGEPGSLIDKRSDVAGDSSFVVGYLAASDGVNSIAIGNYAHATADRGIALGYSAIVSENGIALGSNTMVSNEFSIALGLGSATTKSQQLFVADTIIETSINSSIVLRSPCGNFPCDSTGLATGTMWIDTVGQAYTVKVKP